MMTSNYSIDDISDRIFYEISKNLVEKIRNFRRKSNIVSIFSASKTFYVSPFHLIDELESRYTHQDYMLAYTTVRKNLVKNEIFVRNTRLRI